MSVDIVKELKGKRSMVTVADLSALGSKVKVKHVRPVVAGKPRVLKDDEVHPDHQRDKREKALQYRWQGKSNILVNGVAKVTTTVTRTQNAPALLQSNV